jgi:zinc transporter 1
MLKYNVTITPPSIMAFLQSVSRRLPHISKERRIICVIAIASAFLVLELVVGFITRSLALVADAFHILSDILGYVVAVVAVRYAGRTSKNGQYTYGYRRAETLGGFFNGGEHDIRLTL